MNHARLSLVLLTVVCGISACRRAQPAFEVVVLGGAGGLTEDNLSAYLVRPRGGDGWLALDVGTLRGGVTRAAAAGSLTLPPPAAQATAEDRFIRESIRGYAVSHAHLDHISGLIINSTDDSAKPLYGTAATLQVLRDSVFNWMLWPNFANEGRAPLGRYTYQPMGELEVAAAGTGLTLQAFPLSHGRPYLSTAFLVRAQDDALLYLGDTGADALEGVTHLSQLWQVAAPLIRDGKLKAIFLECSFAQSRSDQELFGHLKPTWFMTELSRLALAVDPGAPHRALRGLTVVVTHVKPGVVDSVETGTLIRSQLEASNRLGIRLTWPVAGQRLQL